MGWCIPAGSDAHPDGLSGAAGTWLSPLRPQRYSRSPAGSREGLLPFSGLAGAVCSTSPRIYGGLGEAALSLQTATRVWAAVRGPHVLEGDPGLEKDKAGAEAVGSHLFG